MTETTTNAPSAAAAVGGRDRLPGKALFGLFLSGFVGILTECLPAGLLPEIGRTLHTSIPLTGQTVTIYALATALGAIPLSRATSKWPRKNVLQLALAIVAVTNALTALSSDYTLTLAIRFVAGLGTGLIWPLLGGYGARLAPIAVRGRAITIALAGTPVALALGIPLGTWIGRLSGWEAAFYLSAALTVANMAWVYFMLPNLPGQAAQDRHKVSKVVTIPGLRLILVALAAYMVAHNILYTYVTDYLNYVGMASQAGWVLFAFGVTSIASVLVVGRHIDHHLRRLTVGSAVLFAVGALVLAIFTGVPALIYIAVAAWGFAFGSSPSLFIGAAINATEEAADVAQSITITVFSSSIAAGGLLGGLLIADLGTRSLAWTTLVLLIGSAIAVIGGRKHAFPRSA